MQANISYLNGVRDSGFAPSNGPFWKLALERWEERLESDDFGFLSGRFFTDELPTHLYANYNILISSRESHEELILAEDNERRLIQFCYWQSEHIVSIYIYSPYGMADATQQMDTYEKQIPPREARGEQWVNVAFWTLAPNGNASYQDRDIEASSWDDVKLNYPAQDRNGRSVRLSLDELHSWTQPPDRGRLMLLHGPAGTGKTRALASLARSWKSWCSIHYVVDPDRFFSSAYYMMSVLLDSGHWTAKDMWRLIIVEDADELLSADAKHRKGQDVSRLLNVCDGLVGQGLRILVLITTNEEVGKMHPAIVRPGRCVANLAIGKLNSDDANHWRTAHNLKPHETNGSSSRNGNGVTLAELYEELTESQITAGDLGPKPIGF